MKWWLVLSVKALIVGAVHLSLIATVNVWMPRQQIGVHLGYSFAVLAADMIVFVLGYFLWQDQKYRCRKCARRLRMPVETGNWSKATIFAPPELEWICPYGHGSMRQKEVHLSGPEADKWLENDDDFWRAFEEAWKKD